MRGMMPPIAALIAAQHRIDAISYLTPINAGVASQARGTGIRGKDAFAARLMPTGQWPMRNFVHIFGWERPMSPTKTILLIILIPESTTAAWNEIGQSFSHGNSL